MTAPGPFHAGLVSGVGSMPGTDPDEATALVAGELAELPHLVELPARGAGADTIGRTLAICVDMPAEVMPTGWRLARRPGRDSGRAADFLAWDVDAAEARFAGAAWVKVQVTGPWTLAAEVETPRGHRALTDAGAVRDLTESLTEGLAAHLADLRRRLPGTGLVVQIDEPGLPAVLAGSLRTASGLATVAAVPAPDVQQLLAGLVDSLGDAPTVAHCCHPAVPLALLRGAGFDALSFDMTAGMTTPATLLDQIGEAVEGDVIILAGLVPTAAPAQRADYRAYAQPLTDIWHALGLPDARLAQVVVTPTCGLAGASEAWARQALSLVRDIGKLLADRSVG